MAKWERVSSAKIIVLTETRRISTNFKKRTTAQGAPSASGEHIALVRAGILQAIDSAERYDLTIPLTIAPGRGRFGKTRSICASLSLMCE